MFNYDLFSQEIGKQQVSTSELNIDGRSAKLYVFTPTYLPEQVLRSYKYNFNPQLIEDILESGEQMSRAVAPNEKGITSPAINSAIIPSTDGLLLDTNFYNNLWTFVLVVDMDPIQYGLRTANQGPNTRFIASGYCIHDEPINPATGTINPNSVLHFTKSNTTRITHAIGPTGIGSNIANVNDMDIVTATTSQLYPNGSDMCINTPGDITHAASTYDRSGNAEIIVSYGALSLSNITKNDTARQIPGLLKTPKMQLGNILRSLDSGVEYSKLHEDGDRVTTDIPGYSNVLQDPYDMAKETFQRQATGSGMHAPVRAGIDTTRPMLMQQLVSIFPSLEIIPFHVPTQGSWDVSPQTAMSPRNMMSSMLASSLTNLAPSCGLGHIAFRYCSYTKPSLYSNDYEGVWQIYDYRTLVPCDSNKQGKCITQFQMYVESELFPMIRCLRGEFDLFAHVNINGEVLIDLNYVDDGASVPGSGFYTTSARLGGLINPMIAPSELVNHNAIQLTNLADTLLTNKLSINMFDRPIIGDVNQSQNPYNVDPIPANVPTYGFPKMSY